MKTLVYWSKALVLGLLLVAGMTACGGKKTGWKVGDKVHVKSATGDLWYEATILEVNKDKYKIHYDGWSSAWDEEVGADRVRNTSEGKAVPPPANALEDNIKNTISNIANNISWGGGGSDSTKTSTPKGKTTTEDKVPAFDAKKTYKKDDKVWVKWGGTWYESQVLEVKGDKYKIHYVGWESSFDEEVEKDRLRPYTE